ncbi:MAG TPA: tRNA 2-selenouridine(34) synthase MnmH, partial [Pseudobdellovibrionaceae bacterium]|nr:tRNA 2-selenouridine(34) synthase MnmH [Pseudobdellovibrionaceae bacterium]
MSLERVGVDDLRNLLLGGARWIDVRAPLEFSKGHLPGAVNLPLLNDRERAAVGTAYKQQGPEAAIALGHRLVQGPVKQARVQAWLEAAKEGAAFLYCFRGGLRSQISQKWLNEAGVLLPLLEGGYKAGRNFLLNETQRLCEASRFLVIAGATGSGKTHLLTTLPKGKSIVDLEGLAAHRGSAFGALDRAQPSQGVFENRLALTLMKSRAQGADAPIVLEDESWTIGKVTLPPALYHRMAEAPLVLVTEPLESRVERIFEDYVRDPLLQDEPSKVFGRFEASFAVLEKR